MKREEKSLLPTSILTQITDDRRRRLSEKQRQNRYRVGVCLLLPLTIFHMKYAYQHINSSFLLNINSSKVLHKTMSTRKQIRPGFHGQIVVALLTFVVHSYIKYNIYIPQCRSVQHIKGSSVSIHDSYAIHILVWSTLVSVEVSFLE
jgi:hypothetical protein